MKAEAFNWNGWKNRLFGATYALLAICCLWGLAVFWIPGTGFTNLIQFGGSIGLPRITQLQEVDFYVRESNAGYDGQFYAQIAYAPDLSSKDLSASIDNLPFRARRILFCWTAYIPPLDDQPTLSSPCHGAPFSAGSALAGTCCG